MEQNSQVRYPFGPATVVQMAASGTINVDVQNYLTLLDGATVQATGARTVNLTIAPDTPVGARIVVAHKASATETLTPGEGMTGQAITGSASKTLVAEYIYTGEKFIQIAEAYQID